MFKGAAVMIVAVLGLLVGPVAQATADDPIQLVVTELDADAFPDVRLVVRVTDASGKAVKGLGPNDIEVSEGGVPQQARLDLAADVSPVHLVLALDVSGSMVGQPLADAKTAIIS